MSRENYSFRQLDENSVQLKGGDAAMKAGWRKVSGDAGLCFTRPACLLEYGPNKSDSPTVCTFHHHTTTSGIRDQKNKVMAAVEVGEIFKPGPTD